MQIIFEQILITGKRSIHRVPLCLKNQGYNNITSCSVQEITEISGVNLITQKLTCFLVVGSHYMNISIYQEGSSSFWFCCAHILALIDTIIVRSKYKLSYETLRTMLACLQHALFVGAVAYTGCGVFSSPWCSTNSSNTRKRQAGREGDVALGLTNDLDTAVWISFTSIAASKWTSLSLHIHMATVEVKLYIYILLKLKKQPTGSLFFFQYLLADFFTRSLVHSLTHSFTASKWDGGKIYTDTFQFLIWENLSAQWVKCFAISRIWLEPG